jgi:uncharacterized damage-inducible protein DinB
MSREIGLLLVALDQAYDHKSWHGTNLRGALRGLTAEEAALRTASGRPSIHELVVLLAYWKYTVLRQLTNLPKGSFPQKGSSWFPRENANSVQWNADRTLLERMHQELRAAVASLKPGELDRPSAKARYLKRDLILGAVAHDLHHGGQIQLIKRFTMKG